MKREGGGPASAGSSSSKKWLGEDAIRWTPEPPRPLALDQLDERLVSYRLPNEAAERAMTRSLEQCGQLSPVVACDIEDHAQLVDGFKRLAAARELKWPTLNVRWLEADGQQVKAAIVLLNRVGGRTRELEEAWVIQALVREDGLTQVEVAELLARHKTWVSRRLALLERLADVVHQELRVGLVSATLVRPLTRLPQGNQCAALSVIHRDSLGRDEVHQLVELLLLRPSTEHAAILRDPRAAISAAGESAGKPRRIGDDDLAKRVGAAHGVVGGLERLLARSRTPPECPSLRANLERLPARLRSLAVVIERFGPLDG